MFFIEKSDVPADALLARYSVKRTYTDCYTTEVPGELALAEFIYAFYTSFLFKLERFILKWTVSRPSTDAEAKELADHARDTFAAWQAEARTQNEILMCDFLGRTRSWLMVAPVRMAGGTRTRLYFGSAVVPGRDSNRAKPSLEFGLRAMLFGFHQLYSVLLLYSARARIQRSAHAKQKSHLPIDG